MDWGVLVLFQAARTAEGLPALIARSRGACFLGRMDLVGQMLLERVGIDEIAFTQTAMELNPMRLPTVRVERVFLVKHEIALGTISMLFCQLVLSFRRLGRKASFAYRALLANGAVVVGEGRSTAKTSPTGRTRKRFSSSFHGCKIGLHELHPR